jgi:hypothetical protein
MVLSKLVTPGVLHHLLLAILPSPVRSFLSAMSIMLPDARQAHATSCQGTAGACQQRSPSFPLRAWYDRAIPLLPAVVPSPLSPGSTRHPAPTAASTPAGASVRGLWLTAHHTTPGDASQGARRCIPTTQAPWWRWRGLDTRHADPLRCLVLGSSLSPILVCGIRGVFLLWLSSSPTPTTPRWAHGFLRS